MKLLGFGLFALLDNDPAAEEGYGADSNLIDDRLRFFHLLGLFLGGSFLLGCFGCGLFGVLSSG